MRIVVVTRENELRHIEPILARLKCEVWETNPVQRPEWFMKAVDAELAYFYSYMTEQAPYWRTRFVIDTDHNLRHEKKKYEPPYSVVQRLKTVKPDYLFVTNLMYQPVYRDYDYALAAKQLGIPVVAFVSRWDALTTKGPMQVEPDIVYCWNDDHRRELMQYHHVPSERIRMVGAWAFEQWVTSYGPKKKQWVYLGSSPNIIANEYNHMAEWLEDVPNGVTPVLVPYPGTVIHTIGTNKFKVAPEKDFLSKYNLYSESERVYGINTSAMLEAMFVGTPAYPIAGDPEKTAQCLHFKQIIPFLSNNHADIRKWARLDEVPSERIARDFVVK